MWVVIGRNRMEEDNGDQKAANRKVQAIYISTKLLLGTQDFVVMLWNLPIDHCNCADCLDVLMHVERTSSLRLLGSNIELYAPQGVDMALE